MLSHAAVFFLLLFQACRSLEIALPLFGKLGVAGKFSSYAVFGHCGLSYVPSLVSEEK